MSLAQTEACWKFGIIYSEDVKNFRTFQSVILLNGYLSTKIRGDQSIVNKYESLINHKCCP